MSARLTDRRFQGLAPMSSILKAEGTVLVKLKRCGIRFEVAAFKARIPEWRSRAVTDLDDVVGIRAVFSNASKVWVV
jgi:ribosome maturation protein Sdo1